MPPMILVANILSSISTVHEERSSIVLSCYHKQPSSFLSVGKSALHWAAAVNNVEAAVVLLKNGANKDMQDNKVCENHVTVMAVFTPFIVGYQID